MKMAAPTEVRCLATVVPPRGTKRASPLGYDYDIRHALCHQSHQDGMAARRPPPPHRARPASRCQHGRVTLVAHHELDVDHLVADDRVHRLVYLDPAVFEAEMARIFGRTWVYVGHESEVAEPGDFKTTTIGRQPVVLVRQPDGTLAVLFNRCSHRASTVCLERRGSAHHFRCPYHGWTFRLDGSLIGATYGDGYDEDDLEGPEFALGRVPRVGSYRGFVFASLAADGPSLREHLGNAAEYLDLFCDLSPTGRLVVGQPGRAPLRLRRELEAAVGERRRRLPPELRARRLPRRRHARRPGHAHVRPDLARAGRRPRQRPRPARHPPGPGRRPRAAGDWPRPPVGPTSRRSPTGWARPGPGRSSAPTADSASTCWCSRTSC